MRNVVYEMSLTFLRPVLVVFQLYEIISKIVLKSISAVHRLLFCILPSSKNNISACKNDYSQNQPTFPSNSTNNNNNNNNNEEHDAKSRKNHNNNYAKNRHKTNKKLGINDVPGPVNLPFIGSSWLYSWFGPYSHKKYHESNDDKFLRYGPVVREKILFNTIIHLFAKDDINKVLNHKTDFPLRPPNAADVFYRQSRPDIYSNLGMVNENGPTWHHLRKLLAPPLMNHLTAANYAAQMCLIGDDFVTLIGKNRQDTSQIVTNLAQLTYRVGLETVCAVALERRMGFLEQDIQFDTQTIMDSIRGYQTASNQAMYEASSFWKYIPKKFSGAFTSLVKHKDNLHDRIGAIVSETIQSEEFQTSRHDESNKCSKTLKTKSILEQLSNVESLTLQDVKTSVVDYITAGVDTIGNTMIFAIGLIAKHPNVQHKLQQEIDQYMSRNTQHEYITPNVIKEMPYLRACVKESFRMYPTASQLARILEVDTEVSGGYILPKNSIVLCHHRVAALQNVNFTRADEFIPERWLEDRPESWNLEPSLVVPFGTGKRSCPGKRLAEQEIHILIVKLFHSFDIQLLDDVNAEFNFLLTPSGPFRLKVTDRSSRFQRG